MGLVSRVFLGDESGVSVAQENYVKFGRGCVMLHKDRDNKKVSVKAI